ncbi:hypothetical protein IEZ26_00665 [Nocardioides cavernae]|uniref:Uncharacterized protein n=1 Tax=Nocardioides cavernae TaxID=1921566 RepID=A0ABR8N6D6_9ACTN|nr:hypothetical protein [Nocardioides cavernae]MBD3923116.1 hypothetical protein [Nocardioides cavernae]MBM7511963.1 hypothetical protein [Nocardioides cavernae]
MLARPVVRLLVAALLVLVTTTVSPTSVARPADGWSRPKVLDPREDTTSTAPTYAVNGAGRTVVAWLSRTVVAPPPEPWEDPVVRTDVRVRQVRRDGRLGPPRTAYSSTHSVDTLRVAMDDAGDLVIGWTEYREETAGYRPWVLRVPRRGAPTPAQLVWGEGSETGISDVAMTPDGTAVVTWLQPRLDASGGTAPPLMLLRRVRPDGSLSPVTDLGMTGGTATVATGDRAFWVAGVPIGGIGSSVGIEVVRVTTSGRIAARRTIDRGPTAERPGLESSGPVLTLDARQDARVLWTRYDSINGGNELVGRVWRAGGSLSRETVVRSGPYGLASIATDARGDSYVTWTSIDTNQFEGFGRPWDRRGRLGPVKGFGRVAWEDLYVTVVHGPTALVDDRGRGVVVWGVRASGDPSAGDSEAPIVTRVRRLHPDGRTARLPGLDLGRPAGAFVTPGGLVLLGFDFPEPRARLVTRR